MTDEAFVFFLFQKDFTEQAQDRYFLFDGESFGEVDVHSIMSDERVLVTHDYWLIAPSIFRTGGSLPTSVIDVIDFQQFITGKRLSRKVKKQLTLKKAIGTYFKDAEILGRYFSAFYRSTKLQLTDYEVFAKHFQKYWGDLLGKSKEVGEWERYLSIEVPVANVLETACAKGIRLDKESLAVHKTEIDTAFYTHLKAFALTHNMHFEVPSDAYLKDELTRRGYGELLPELRDSWSKYRLDDFLELTPMKDNFGTQALDLRKTSRSRQALASISAKSARVHPILDSHATVTSRIYYQNPTIQNMARKYRDIFRADAGKTLVYVDYDQFEIGIMAALSKDNALLDIYASADVYTEFANNVLQDSTKRGMAKGLFLSFTYGMQIDKIIELVVANGGSEGAAREFFSQFEVFIQWKTEIAESFRSQDRVGTCLGNYLNRINEGPLTAKEKRSCVSQVVQGTGSLIFKKAIIELDSSPLVDVLIPMHDATLIQHTPEYEPSEAVLTLQSAMQYFLGTDFPAQASIEDFA